MSQFKINNRIIGSSSQVYVIAELSANHNQDLDLAVKTIEAMKAAGADAVKIQTFNPGSMTLDINKPWFMARKDSLWSGQRLYELYVKAATPYEWHPILKEKAENLGLDFFSSPFDKEGVDLLESLEVPAYKIASLEITDIPLISYIAAKGKPVIISTGIADHEDIQLALATCYEQDNRDIALLKCTSAYPTPIEESNIGAISYLADTYGVVAGLSDHSLGIEIPIAAVAVGAKIIEKHFILDKSIDTPDSAFSLDKDEFKAMVDSIRAIEKALEPKEYLVNDKMKSARVSARSLFAIENIRKGEKFTKDNIKPIHPKYYHEILNKTAKSDIETGTPISWDLIDN
jgi:pseudaminic acid synthase